MSKQYRQGDVLLTEVDAVPSGTVRVKRDNGRVVLAYGEVTGHAHAIKSHGATLWDTAEINERFLEITRDVKLEHEEHGSVTLPPGSYRVTGQQEYTSTATRPRPVSD